MGIDKGIKEAQNHNTMLKASQEHSGKDTWAPLRMSPQSLTMAIAIAVAPIAARGTSGMGPCAPSSWEHERGRLPHCNRNMIGGVPDLQLHGQTTEISSGRRCPRPKKPNSATCGHSPGSTLVFTEGSFAIAQDHPTWTPPEPLVVLSNKQPVAGGADNLVRSSGRSLIDHLQSICPSRPTSGISALRIGSLATTSAPQFFVRTQQLLQKTLGRVRHALVVATSVLLGPTMRERSDGVVGSRIGALNQSLPYARQFSNRRDRIHSCCPSSSRSCVCSDANCATPQRGFENFEPICPPHLFSQTVDVIGESEASVSTHVSIPDEGGCLLCHDSAKKIIQVPDPPWLAQQI